MYMPSGWGAAYWRFIAGVIVVSWVFAGSILLVFGPYFDREHPWAFWGTMLPALVVARVGWYWWEHRRGSP